VTQVAAARAEGRSLEQTQSQVDVAAFREYFVTDDAAERYWAFFIPEAVRRAFEEAAPAP